MAKEIGPKEKALRAMREQRAADNERRAAAAEKDAAAQRALDAKLKKSRKTKENNDLKRALTEVQKLEADQIRKEGQ